MKFLVIGLGSMGKRRIRCLKALGYDDIIGYDTMEKRKNDAKINYDIQIADILSDSMQGHIDGVIISTPPDKHFDCSKFAIQKKTPVFIEASVILEDVINIIEYNKNFNTFIAPSCTLKFHPIIKELRSIVNNGQYGKLSNFNYHSGQYLPDWHPWENVKDFYVSKKETGGAREIVPFELTWITDIFGIPKDIKGYYGKTIDVDADIDDTYSFIMKFDNGIGTVVVDVTSRFATRSLVLNLEKAQIRWNWEEGMLKIFDSKEKTWVQHNQHVGNSESGYNKNIIEQMYVDEIESFISGLKGISQYPNSIENDLIILRLLNTIEKSDGGFIR